MTKQEAEFLNKKLAEAYGIFHGQPRFRLVWSTDLTEMRTGDFKVEVKGWEQLDLGTAHETKVVPKYSYAMDRWVLEELIYSEFTPKELVAQGPLSYEPLYVFWEGDAGDYVEPDELKIAQICTFRLTNSLKNFKITPKQLEQRKQELIARNRAKIREKLDEALPDTAHAIVHGEGVAMGRGLKEMK
jgi:hypothetical protein